MDAIKGKVRAYIDDNFIMGGDVRFEDDSSFMKEHILDSTGFIELITFIEEMFNLSVTDQEMVPENFDSLNNIEAYVTRKCGVAA